MPQHDAGTAEAPAEPADPLRTAHEMAALICSLCSEEASFSTGAVFDCCGGRATY